jgi:hypothetical protein
VSANLSNRLPALAAEIRAAHADAETAAKTATARAIEAGERLLEAKELVRHGEWLSWLRDNVGVSPRMAQNYMRIAKHRAKCETVSHLRDALAGIADAADPFDDTGRWATPVCRRGYVQADGKHYRITVAPSLKYTDQLYYWAVIYCGYCESSRPPTEWLDTVWVEDMRRPIAAHALDFCLRIMLRGVPYDDIYWHDVERDNALEAIGWPRTSLLGPAA